MSIRKNAFVIISARIKWFPVFFLFPLRSLSEVVEGAQDLLSLFGRAAEKAYEWLYVIEAAIMQVRDYGPLDIADVDIKNPNAHIRVKILMR